MPFADKVKAHDESEYFEEQGWLYNVMFENPMRKETNWTQSQSALPMHFTLKNSMIA